MSAFLDPGAGPGLVLRALDDGHWRTPAEIADQSGLMPGLVRDALRDLAAKGLVERGGWGESQRWGEWRLTQAGSVELNQLRLV